MSAAASLREDARHGFAREWRAAGWWVARMRSATRVAHARWTGASVGVGCVIEQGAEVALGNSLARRGEVALGARAEISRGCLLHPYGGSICLGEDVHLGPGTVVYGHGGVLIGDYALVAMHCRILSSNHTVPSAGTLIRSQPDVLLPTKIGRDVWLGAAVTVLGGVTIGEGCIVGAGAVVTKDLAPWSIATGVPARVKGRRGEVTVIGKHPRDA